MSYLIGQQIENYKIESIIGEGGMGTVCRAIDVDLDRPVALKVMHPQYLAQAEFQARFQQEARAVARLDHPAIVKIYRFGRTPAYLYIVMELIPGISLGDYIAQVSQTQQIIRLDETLLVMAQVADALGYAHRHGVIHRDVKPDNVLVKKIAEPEGPSDPPLRAVVTDFGLAKLAEGGIHTQTGTFIGTLPYMSPEQVLGKPLDGRSDIYSLGVVLFQLATGQLPFDIKTPTDAILQHLHSQPPEPHRIRPGLPFAVEHIILTALAKEPEYRYQTGSEIAQELRQAAAKLDEASIVPGNGGEKPVSMVTRFEAARQKQAASPPLPPPAEKETAVPPSPPSAKEAATPEAATPEAATHELTANEANDKPTFLPDTFAQVVVTSPGGESRTFPLDKPQIRIGRAAENDLVLPSKGVSHTHALLAQTDQGWQITDLNSTNGVILDTRKIPPQQPTLWPPYAMVRISDNWLQLLPGQPLPAGPPAVSALATTNVTRARVRLPANRLTIDPGASTALTVLVHNQGDFADSFAVTVTGLDKSWLPARAPLVRLAAGEQREVTIPIQPPGAGVRPGSYPFTVQVSSQVGPEELVETPAEVVIAAARPYAPQPIPPQFPSPRQPDQKATPARPGSTQVLLIWLLGFCVTLVLTFLALALGGRIAEATGRGLPVLICPSVTLIMGLTLTVRLAQTARKG